MISRTILIPILAIFAFDVGVVLLLRWILGPRAPYGLIALPINLYVGWLIGRTSGKWFK